MQVAEPQMETILAMGVARDATRDQSALGDTDNDAGEDGDDAAMNMSKTCVMNAQNVYTHVLSEPSLNEIVQRGDVLGRPVTLSWLGSFEGSSK